MYFVCCYVPGGLQRRIGLLAHVCLANAINDLIGRHCSLHENATLRLAIHNLGVWLDAKLIGKWWGPGVGDSR